MAAQSGAQHVLGIDVTPKYIEQANLLKRALSLTNAEFELMAIEDLDPAEVGTFDVVLNFGILYHLENPVLAMKRLADVAASVMLVETAIDRDGGDRPTWRMDILEPVEDEDRVASTGLWRTGQVCQLFPTLGRSRRRRTCWPSSVSPTYGAWSPRWTSGVRS